LLVVLFGVGVGGVGCGVSSSSSFVVVVFYGGFLRCLGGGFRWGFVWSLFGRCSFPCHARALVERFDRSFLSVERDFRDEMLLSCIY